jgi:4'-phosphopantetheinyl transferase
MSSLEMKSTTSRNMRSEVRELLPPAAGVSLWLASLDRTPDEVASLALGLSPQEHKRAERFGTPLLRARWIAGRATLRQLLADILNTTPGDVRLKRGVRGRPELEGVRSIDFNVSHTDGIAMIGIAHALPLGVRIGVDLERVARSVNADGLARKFLTANERAESAPLSVDERRVRFLHLWTCKEAMSKATGDALSAPFGKMDVSLQGGPTLIDGPAPYLPHLWTLVAAAAPPELIGTVAIWEGM